MTLQSNFASIAKSLELLTNFEIENGRMVFIYFTPIR